MRRSIPWLVLVAAGCAPAASQAPAPAPASAQQVAVADTISSVDRPQYPSTYTRHPYPPVVIRHATILTGTGAEITDGAILLQDGKIVAVGKTVAAPAGAIEIDGTGKYVTPGIIDTHSHIGVYAAPGTWAESDGNELPVNPNTAYVWAEHSFWPQDPQIPRAIAGGITTAEILPGSGNLIGGRSVVLRFVPARSVQEMKFPGAPYGVKMACGENPKRVYGQRGGPATRMGNMAGYRAAYIAAEQYKRKWDEWNKTHKGDPPARDLRNETLAGVLSGKFLVQMHCYRADEMMQMIDLGREFGFKIRSFHHVVEGYKIADKLAADSVGANVWSDWWGFKEEAMDGIQENAALLDKAGVVVTIHSDDPNGIQRLNQAAAQAMWAGRRAGMHITEAHAIKWITSNPAWILGIDSATGTLEPGKHADVVLWTKDPFSVYTHAEKVFNDGWLVYDRDDPAHQPRTDFELGQVVK